MIANNIIHTDTHGERHALFNCHTLHLLLIQFGCRGVDDGGAKLWTEWMDLIFMYIDIGIEWVDSLIEMSMNACNQCNVAMLLTLHKSNTLAPGTHCSINPLRAKFTILDASWYLVHTSLRSMIIISQTIIIIIIVYNNNNSIMGWGENSERWM